ncbi:MAG: hypothetical protein KJ043_00015 [Anaerolineae bacterium]|nr:hypothetical protein [Anaerolineae bacterium]
MLRLIITFIFISLIFIPAHAQPTNPPITPDHIHQLQQQHVFGRGYVSNMSYTPDGESLLVQASLGLWRYDAQDLSIETQLDMTGQFLGYYLDGRYMVFMQEPKTLQIFDGTTETLLYEVALGDDNYQFNGFSADGRHLFTTYYNRETREHRMEIWEIERGNFALTISGIYFSELTPDDKRVIIKAPQDDHTYMVWDRATHTLSSSLDGTERFLAGDVKFNSDGTRYMLSSDYNVYLYDAFSETLIQELKPFENENYYHGIRNYVFTPDSQYILGAGYNRDCYCATYGTFIFDGLTGDYSQDITQPYKVSYLTFSPTGKYVIQHQNEIYPRFTPQRIVRRVGTWEEIISIENFWFSHPQNDQILYYEDNHYKTVNLDTGEIIDIGNFNTPFAVASYGSWLMFSPKDTYLVSTSGDSIFLWDAQTKALVRKFSAEAVSHVFFDTIQYLFFSDDEKFLIATRTEGMIYIWDIEENQLVHTIQNQECHTYPDDDSSEYGGGTFCTAPSDLVEMTVHQAFLDVGTKQHPTISPDNRYFAIAFGNQVLIYDMETGEIHYEIQVPNTGILDGLWFTSDSRFIFALSTTRAITKWDIENQTQVYDSGIYESAHDNIPERIILDDQFFIIKGTQIHFLDKETGNVSRIFETIHQEWISKARLSGNGKVLFTHDRDGLSLLWDLETGSYTHLSNQFEVNWDNPVQFNFDGSILIADCLVDDAERFCLYDGKTGEFLEAIDAPINDDIIGFNFDEYVTVVFNQSGTQMAVNKGDGTIRLWGIGD